MSAPTLHTHVVLDRPYKIRFDFRAKQNMASLRDGAFTLKHCTEEATSEAATVAWIWASIDEPRRPFATPYDLGGVWEKMSEDAQIEAIKSFWEAVALAQPKPKAERDPNASAGSSPSPALNSA